MTSSKNPETIALHAGWRKDDSTNSVAVPIYQTTSINLIAKSMLPIFFH